VHACPVALQQFLLAPQVRPLQQSAPLLHAMPTVEQPHAPVPALHTPVQQSAAALQDVPLAMQPHLLVELQKGFGPQQSPVVLQLCPVPPQPQVEVAELQTLVQHWLAALQGCASSRQGVWQSPSTPQVIPGQQSGSCPHGWFSFEQPHVSVMLLQTRLQQFAYDPPHGAPSGWQVPQTSSVPVSRQIRPSQQSGPYRMSSPEHGPPGPPQPQSCVA